MEKGFGSGASNQPSVQRGREALLDFLFVVCHVVVEAEACAGGGEREGDSAAGGGRPCAAHRAAAGGDGSVCRPGAAAHGLGRAVHLLPLRPLWHGSWQHVS